MWVLFLSAVGLSVGSHPPALLAHPWVMTGGCASIAACDGVDIIGDLLVPLKLFSVRVVFFFFFNLQATVRPVVFFTHHVERSSLHPSYSETCSAALAVPSPERWSHSPVPSFLAAPQFFHFSLCVKRVLS